MNRTEFCQLLENLRLEQGVSFQNLSLKTLIFTTRLMDIVRGRQNFNMKNCYIVLTALNAYMILNCGGEERAARDYNGLIDILANQRKKIPITQAQLAQSSGCSPQLVLLIENKRTTLSVDVFLAFLNTMNIQLTIKLI